MNKTSETTLVVERIIDASAENIFNALTEESQLKQWLYPIKQGFSVEVEFNAEVGGRYQIDMIDPDGKYLRTKGGLRN